MEIKKMEQLTFEQAIERLELIASKLEQGDVPLEQSIELFQEGMALSKLCSGKLEQAEQKIQMLMENDQQLHIKPFAEQNEEKGV